MSRIVWKGPFIDEKIYSNIKKNTVICSRNLIITPNLIGLNFLVHNGKNLLSVKILEDMIGQKQNTKELIRMLIKLYDDDNDFTA